MAMITDEAYVIHAIRLTSLRNTDDPVTSRILSLQPAFAANPYINAAGLADIDNWPEISRALDSPPLDPGFSSWEDGLGDARQRDRKRGGRSKDDDGRGAGLKYTQTIMGPDRTGGMGMRVSGRRTSRDWAGKIGTQGTGYAATGTAPQISPIYESTPTTAQQPTMDDGFFSPTKSRQRADSAPGMAVLPSSLGATATTAAPSSLLETGHGLGAKAILDAAPLERALGTSLTSNEYDIPEDGYTNQPYPSATGGIMDGSSMGAEASARPSEMRMTISDERGPLGDEDGMIDEGSDVEEEDMEDEGIRLGPDSQPPDRRRSAYDPPHNAVDRSPRSSTTFAFASRSNPDPLPSRPKTSALTAQLNKHVPHLVSTAEPSAEAPASSVINPFASLYSSVSAPSSLPGLQMELFFPHSNEPMSPISVKVRKDASVEEVTGLGLCKYWEENREPKLVDMDEEDREVRWTTVGWGLRIVEDDGEVDEDFPPLDRESQVSKFSYGQFAIVEATDSQVRQNAAKAPHIVRRPSRIIAPARAAEATAAVPSSTRSKMPASVATSDPFLNDAIVGSVAGTTMKGSVGLSSALSRPVLLRIKVTASADVHFTTTISVPSDMYIADLTEILCKRKRLPMPATDWVLCLADLSLALPLDRTVASLGGKTDLALVRRQWAVEHGLRADDRRGGDPSASIFKRISEPPVLNATASGFADFAQSYKKFHVTRRMAIGRHERVLAIDGDYIHIMPSEQRAFFDSTKTTSFHITLIASCKLSGNSGGFKLLVWRDGGQKRYDFEAKNVKQAAEIITSIRQVMRTYQAERSSMLPPPRPAPKSPQK